MTAVTTRLLPRTDITASAKDYLRTEAGGAVLLLLATVAALVWANGPWSDSYDALWDTHLSVQLGGSAIDESLRHWVNDGLMTLFFLLVGLEIARELSVGEYQDRRAVIAPALAAVGGLVVPAALYLAIAGADGPEAHGWGIAISTDTAFALGVLALVGPRCPNRLRIFLLALAIVDDVAAIGVIAVFYTDDLDLGALGIAGLLFLALVVLRALRVSNPVTYGVVAVLLWLATYASGVHPTVAGVGMGLLFVSAAPATAAANEGLTRRLHPVVSFAVVPLFALANAGVPLGGDALRDAATSPVGIGIVVGLVVGKLLGVLAGTWCALRLPASRFVGGVRWGQVTGVASVAGIGFTIALFVTDLAFDDPALQQDAKIGILAGSLLAALLSLGVFRFLSARGGLCLPEDVPVSLPALRDIPDPD